MRCADAAGASDVDILLFDGRFATASAELHAQALADDVLPALGPRFLTRYYATVLADDTQIVIGALRAGLPVGLCQLSFAPLGAWAVLKSQPTALLSIARLALLNMPLVVRGLRMASPRPIELRGIPEISFIAVRPDSQQLGIGKRMVRAANDLAAGKGYTSLITKTSNPNARRMYENEFDARAVQVLSDSQRTYWYLCWHTRTATDPVSHVAT